MMNCVAGKKPSIKKERFFQNNPGDEKREGRTMLEDAVGRWGAAFKKRSAYNNFSRADPADNTTGRWIEMPKAGGTENSRLKRHPEGRTIVVAQ